MTADAKPTEAVVENGSTTNTAETSGDNKGKGKLVTDTNANAVGDSSVEVDGEEEEEEEYDEMEVEITPEDDLVRVICFSFPRYHQTGD